MNARANYVVLSLFCLIFMAPGLASLPPVDRDESRYLQATKQMLETGDFIDIRFQDQARYKKPAGIYWAQSLAATLTGRGANAPLWAFRIVSLIGLTLAVLATCWTGSALFGPSAGLVAGLVVAAIFGSGFESRLAKTDAMLLGLCTLAQGAMAQIYMSVRAGRKPAGALAWIFWGAEGLAILVKGPIAPFLALLTVVALSIAQRDWRWLKAMRPLSGVVLALLIAAPWFVLITWRASGAFWHDAVGGDLMGKVTSGQESHGAPPGYYMLTYCLYMWPFGPLALAAELRAWNGWRGDDRLAFLLCWFVPFWIVLEFVPTKLPHYLLPAYPALAILVGWTATTLRTGNLTRWQAIACWAAVAGQAAVTVVLAGAAVGLPIYLGDGVSVAGIVCALLILVAGIVGLRWWSRVGVGSIAANAAIGAAGVAALFGWVAPSVPQLWLSKSVADAIAANRPCPTSVLASAGYAEPSLVVLAGTATQFTSAEGAAKHLLDDPSCGLALVDQESDAAFHSAAGAAAVIPLAKIAGINYSIGRRKDLTLYGMGAAR